MNYSELDLPETLHRSLERMNFTTPTPIQAATIPLGLAGKDVLGTAQTGTGKTAAFAIPLVAHILANPDHTGLILLPTRELATQVMTVIDDLLGAKTPIRTALLIGGESIYKQFQQLRNRPRIVVGTPGRVIDHLQRGTVELDKTHLLVLDETDRMLDMGFGVQLDEIVAALPTPRQTLMFSATMPQNIIKLSRKYLVNPERVEIGSTAAVATNIQQDLIRTPESGKFAILKEELDKREGTVIIFVKTKMGCDRLADKLDAAGHSAAPIHGDLRQRERDRVVRDFRVQRFRILVATDVAARGLDIPHIAHVINYDLPQSPEDYIHRLGRTARAGAEGAAVSFIAPDDHAKWRAIHKLLNPTERLEGFEGGEKLRKGRGGFGGAGGGARRPFNRDRRDEPANDYKPRRDSSSPRADRAFADRPARAGGDRPQFSDKPRGEAPRAPRSDRAERPTRDFAPRRDFGDRPARAGGDRPQYSDRPRGEEPRAPRPDRAERPNRDFAPRRDFGDRPARASGDRPQYNDRPRGEEPRAPRPYNADRPNRDAARPARATGDRPTYAPRGDKPAFSAKSGAARTSAPKAGERKNYVRSADVKPDFQKRERKAAW